MAEKLSLKVNAIKILKYRVQSLGRQSLKSWWKIKVSYSLVLTEYSFVFFFFQLHVKFLNLSELKVSIEFHWVFRKLWEHWAIFSKCIRLFTLQDELTESVTTTIETCKITKKNVQNHM